jgi:spoIIIJ-associated protein
MENLKEITKKLVGMIGFRDANVDFDEMNKRVLIFIDDEFAGPSNVSELIDHFSRILKLVAKKFDEGPVTIDVNNYRKEREKLIIELARAGARKASTTKKEVALPPMNAYERRLVHSELSLRPDIKTESIGEGSGRQVIIKILE